MVKTHPFRNRLHPNVKKVVPLPVFALNLEPRPTADSEPFPAPGNQVKVPVVDVCRDVPIFIPNDFPSGHEKACTIVAELCVMAMDPAGGLPRRVDPRD
jgi:hypothetical protein